MRRSIYCWPTGATEGEIQPEREVIAEAYRDRRLARDDAAADVLARQAFRLGMLQPRNAMTGKPRRLPMTEGEFRRWLRISQDRWHRWLESPGPVRPPRLSDDGRRLAGF